MLTVLGFRASPTQPFPHLLAQSFLFVLQTCALKLIGLKHQNRMKHQIDFPGSRPGLGFTILKYLSIFSPQPL